MKTKSAQQTGRQASYIEQLSQIIDEAGTGKMEAALEFRISPCKSNG